MLSSEVAPEPAAQRLLCSPGPSSLCRHTEGSAQGFQPAAGTNSPWSKDTEPCPGLKPPTAALRGLQGSGITAQPRCCPGESRAHTQQGLTQPGRCRREKPSPSNTETETAGQDLALVPAGERGGGQTSAAPLHWQQTATSLEQSVSLTPKTLPLEQISYRL